MCESVNKYLQWQMTRLTTCLFIVANRYIYNAWMCEWICNVITIIVAATAAGWLLLCD